MKLALMQPYFMPYLGHFSLIKHTDVYIIFDTVQFINRGWIERNRILKPDEGWQYIRVPIKKHSSTAAINDVYICNDMKWQEKILNQLQHYKKKAPFYDDVMLLMQDIFSKEFDKISEFNEYAIKAVCKYLDINTPIYVFSKMNMEIEPVHAADEWGLNVCLAYEGVTEYWNAPGGKSFFDKSKYDKKGIQLKFQKMVLTPYDQGGRAFEEGLSIIDVLMFNSVDEVHKMLDNYEII